MIYKQRRKVTEVSQLVQSSVFLYWLAKGNNVVKNIFYSEQQIVIMILCIKKGYRGVTNETRLLYFCTLI